MSELCLVEMDRLYPSENMASASRGLASAPFCLWRSGAWRRGAPGRRGTAAGAAARVPRTAAACWRRGPHSPAWSTAPTSAWRGPQQPRTSRWLLLCCKTSLNSFLKSISLILLKGLRFYQRQKYSISALFDAVAQHRSLMTIKNEKMENEITIFKASFSSHQNKGIKGCFLNLISYLLLLFSCFQTAN